jgi:hypothetical protein
VFLDLGGLILPFHDRRKVEVTISKNAKFLINQAAQAIKKKGRMLF